MRQYLWRLVPRAWRILWGPTAKFVTGSATVLTLIAFLNQPLLNLISTTWQGIPWWVGLIALIPLLFYAFVRGSYEEYRAVTEPHTVGGTTIPVPQPRPSREIEQLEKQLRRTELELRRTKEERDRYRAIVSDPTAKRRREEERLYQRCVHVGNEIRNFLSGYGSVHDSEQHVVQRFSLRHY
jgi:hypothetical protein